MDAAPLDLARLLDLFAQAAGVEPATIDLRARTTNSHDFYWRRLHVQLTIWPDLGSATRGRLTPEGTIAPSIEHILANEGGY
jgi:hypothetical protein